MSFSTISESSQPQVQVVYTKRLVSSSSSEEPPMEEWSSLDQCVVEDSPKMALFKAGLFDPGSGNICTKYITISASEVLRHPYYNYPGIKDPGIVKALLEPEDQTIYSRDGQDLYLSLCKEMNIIPIRKFHRGLIEESINLKYYGVNPIGVRAMCLALTYNSYVVRMDLTGNFLDNDACYHLGKLLGESLALQELIVSSCKIQSEGMRRLTAFLSRRSIDLLDLSKNELGDDGLQHLADQLRRKTIIARLNLSYNNLGSNSALALAEVLEYNNTITHLDLSWNQLASKGLVDLLRQLGRSTVLVELNLSWNGLAIGAPLRGLFNVPTLQILDLSNNRLSTLAAKAIALKLQAAKQLETLVLSFNPILPPDALLILSTMRAKNVVLKNLLMENIPVKKDFVEVLRDYTLSVPDMREIVLNRMDFLTSKATKKCQMDIALYFLQKIKDRELMQPREILKDMKIASAPVDEDLVDGLANEFPGPKTDKGGKTIKLAGVVDMIARMWPERRLPPTPPEPEPEPVVKGKKKKSKK